MQIYGDSMVSDGWFSGMLSSVSAFMSFHLLEFSLNILDGPLDEQRMS